MTPQISKDTIHWLGHDTFRLEGSKVVYFDPYELSGGPRADVILITHDHFDHCSPTDVAKIRGADTLVVAPEAASRKIPGQVMVVRPGDRVSAAGLEIEVHPAYNLTKPYHPRDAGMVSFVVILDRVRYYHAGDTDCIPEMAEIEADVAFLPVSGTYVMDAEEAVRAARFIGPRVVVPMHYGAIVGSEDDARAFASSLSGEMEVWVLSKE